MDVKIDKNIPIPLYYQIYEKILKAIQQGLVKPWDPLPTEKELAEKLGVNRRTIAHAYQELRNRNMLIRQRGKGTFVYRAMNNTRTVGLLIPELKGGILSYCTSGIRDIISRRNYALLMCNSDYNFNLQRQYVDMLIDRQAAGVIFTPIDKEGMDKEGIIVIEKLKKHNIPVVQMDRVVDGRYTDCVTSNNREGACTLTNYLIKKGHRRIGFIHTFLSSVVEDRLKGYRQALEKNGIKYDEALIRLVDHDEKKLGSTAIRKFLSMKNPPTAIFAIHDFFGLNIVLTLMEKRLRVPADMAVVCYDDLIAELSPVPLTTMSQPLFEMGRKTAEILFDRIDGKKTYLPQKIVLKSKLVVRNSA